MMFLTFAVLLSETSMSSHVSVYGVRGPLTFLPLMASLPFPLQHISDGTNTMLSNFAFEE